MLQEAAKVARGRQRKARDTPGLQVEAALKARWSVAVRSIERERPKVFH